MINHLSIRIAYHRLVSLYSVPMWYLKKESVPPIYIKRRIIKSYANQFNLRTFIETGTYLGETVNSVKNTFDTIYSIELDKELYNNAKARFVRNEKIEIIHGDSSEALAGLLPKINQSCLFWLDAHYSAGITAKGDDPIMKELEAIINNYNKHVILIDDACNFTGNNGCPEFKNLKIYIHSLNKDLLIYQKHDIIRIHQPL